MSNWTDEKHEQVRRRLEATDGALHCGWDDGLDDPMQEVVVNAYDDLADALFEIERLRALTTITDDMVEKACQVYTDDPYRPAKGTLRTTWGTLVQVSPQTADDRRSAMRSALEAALNPKDGAS